MTTTNCAATIEGMVATQSPPGASKSAAEPTKATGARKRRSRKQSVVPSDTMRVAGVPAPQGAPPRVAADEQGTVALQDVVDEVSAEHADTDLTGTEADTMRRLLGGVLSSRAHRGSRWAELLGPVATPKVVTSLLGITRQGLDKARDRGDVLGVRTSSGNWVYPLRQLRGTSGRVKVLDGLPEVLRALYSTGDSAAAARWLATGNRRLGGATPWDALWAGDNLDAVLEAAEAQSRAWTAR